MNNLYFRSLTEDYRMIKKNIKAPELFTTFFALLIYVLVLSPSSLSAQEPQLADTTQVCFADSVLLDAGSDFQSYLWSTDEQSQTIWAFEPGWYYVWCTLETMEVVKDSTWLLFQNTYIDMTDTVLTCYTYPVTLCASTDTLVYKWTSNDPDLFIEYDTAACVDVVPINDTTTVFLNVNDSLGFITCVDSVQIWLYPRMRFEEVEQINTGCPGSCKGQLQVTVSGGLRPYKFEWPNAPPGNWDSIAFGLCESSYKLVVEDGYNCERDTMLPVEVFDMPEVEIVREPEEEIFIKNPVVTFSFDNLSIDSIQIIDWNWNFGDSTFTKEENPVKVFDQIRAFDVWLKYTTNNECIDSVTMQVDIKPFKPEIPNFFTPNGDTENQQFVIEDLDRYISNELKVFNRYGKKVFSQTDYQNNWDGDKLREGVYFYVLTAEGYFGTETYKGAVTILR